jgi:ribosomal protein S18 acetylase RimI-like enzyme
MRADERAKRWAERIPTFPQNRQTLMVVVIEGDIVGFAGCGPRREDKLAVDGEIYMINILARAKRQRIGAQLMHAMAKALETNGFAAAGLWVLEKNLPARAFYERIGGTPDIAIQQDHDGVLLTDIAILWPRIATLKERAAQLLSA